MPGLKARIARADVQVEGRRTASLKVLIVLVRASVLAVSSHSYCSIILESNSDPLRETAEIFEGTEVIRKDSRLIKLNKAAIFSNRDPLRVCKKLNFS